MLQQMSSHILVEKGNDGVTRRKAGHLQQPN